MRVFVYYNLNKHVFSVKAMEGPRKGRVVAHMAEVFLRDVELKVSIAGRNRVLARKVRSVHAGAIGTLCEATDMPCGPANIVTYNPYKGETFVDLTRDYVPVTGMQYAQFVNRRICAWGAV